MVILRMLVTIFISIILFLAGMVCLRAREILSKAKYDEPKEQGRVDGQQNLMNLIGNLAYLLSIMLAWAALATLLESLGVPIMSVFTGAEL